MREALSPERGGQSLYQVQQVGFLAQETGGGSPRPGTALSFRLHTGFQSYLFLRLEWVGLGSLVASCCCPAKRILAAAMSLSRWRSSPAVAHVLPAWTLAAGATLPGSATASGQGLRWQKVAQAGSLALQHSQRLGRERRRRLGGFPRP